MPLVLCAYSFAYHRRCVFSTVDFVIKYAFYKGPVYRVLLYVVAPFCNFSGGIKNITQIFDLNYWPIRRKVWLHRVAFESHIPAWFVVLTDSATVLHTVRIFECNMTLPCPNQTPVALRTWISLCTATYKGLQRKTMTLMSSMYFIWPLSRMLRVPWLPRRWSKRWGDMGLW